MHLEAHAGLGWLVGVLAPGSDRRLRAWCVGAAILPDVDAAAYLAGPVAYMNYHHTFGHNVLLGVAFAGLAAWHHRGRGGRRVALAASLVAACFASHLLADMRLSAYPVHLLWPFSARGWEFTPNLGIGAPINVALVYVSFAVSLVLALWKQVTPLELLHPRLDALVVSFFRRRTGTCATCARGANVRCLTCDALVCPRHVKLRRWFRAECPACSGAR